MSTRFPPPTEAQLREAYSRTQLARMGITFEAALQDRAITCSLTGMVNSDRRWAEMTLGQGSRRIERMNKDE